MTIKETRYNKTYGFTIIIIIIYSTNNVGYE